MADETSKFQKAVNLFFGMNPAKRYWILLALYFAKIRKLYAIDNYTGVDGGLVLASMSISHITHKDVANIWVRKNIQNRSIVALVPEDQKNIIDEINAGFDVDANNHLNYNSNNDLGFGFSQMEPTYLVEVAETLIELSDSWYEQNSKWAFDMLIRRAIRPHEKAENYQPTEMVTLMANILNAKNGKVYNPYAGVCSFGAALSSDCFFYGQELSNSYIVGKLNLLFNGKENAVCEQGNPLNNWKGGEHFDYIVSIPPSGVSSDSQLRSMELDYLYRSAHDAHCKAIGLYPSYLCSDGAMSFATSPANPIKELIQKDYVEGVILLPRNGSYYGNGLIIITSKQKPNRNVIRFVDASRSFEKTGRENKILVDLIVAQYNSDSEHSRNVHISEIEANGFNIYPKRYFGKDIVVPTGMKVLSLSKVLTPMRMKRPTGNQGRVFSFSIKRDSVNADGIVKSKDLEVREVNGHFYRLVNEDCLVINRGGFFSAKYLITNGEDVFVNPLYRLFHVDTEIIDPLYLLSELSKEYFLEQVSRYADGITVQKIAIKDFLGLKILVPEVREQQIKMSLDTIEKNLETLEGQIDAEYKSKMDSFILNQRQRKHAVTQVLNEILPSMENIESFILDNETVSKDSVVSRRFGTTLQTYLSTVRKQLDKVASMVDNFTSLEQYGEPETIQVQDFLSEYCSSKKTLGIPVDYIHHYEEEEIEQEVKISKKDLTQMLDNLIANAVKYGTTDDIEHKYGSADEKRRDFQILIETHAVHDYKEPVAIRISNNGEAVSKSISLDKLFTWGIGRGTGIGCWQVKEIAEHFGGSASYEEFPNDPNGFVSEFRIVLPLDND